MTTTSHGLYTEIFVLGDIYLFRINQHSKSLFGGRLRKSNQMKKKQNSFFPLTIGRAHEEEEDGHRKKWNKRLDDIHNNKIIYCHLNVETII